MKKSEFLPYVDHSADTLHEAYGCTVDLMRDVFNYVQKLSIEVFFENNFENGIDGLKTSEIINLTYDEFVPLYSKYRSNLETPYDLEMYKVFLCINIARGVERMKLIESKMHGVLQEGVGEKYEFLKTTAEALIRNNTSYTLDMDSVRKSLNNDENEF